MELMANGYNNLDVDKALFLVLEQGKHAENHIKCHCRVLK